MGNEKEIRLPWPGWTIGKYLGAGGYGKVYEIERTLSGVRERAALKVVSRPADDAEIEACYENGYDQASMKASYEEEIQRYVKEYELMKELQGQTNIVSCDDFAVVPRKDGIGGQIFIRMELLTPLQKATMPTKQSMLSESEVIRLGKDICKALMLCEARHIIHRDIKPENILISKFGDYKLGDFGVARVQDHTTNATKMGTHGYAAPEVEHGQKYGKEADIYSLGITLYWLLNNRRMPFLNADEPVTAMKNQEALRRRYEGEKLPAPKNGSQKLKQIVLKACAYRPVDRYRSAQELYDALAELSGEQTDTASYAIPDCPVDMAYRKRVASGKAGHAAASAGAASGDSDFDDLFAAMNGEQSGTGTFSSGSKNATDTSFGAGYSGKTEGNGWDDATSATIGKPKSKKTSGAATGTVSRQAQSAIDKTMGKTAAYQKQEKQKKQKKQTAREFMEEEKKEKNDADFLIVVYGVTSVLVLFCAFMSSIGDVTRLSSVARNTRQEFLYRKGLYEVGMSVFVWLGLALAVDFVKTWKASKSIRIIGPVLQIHAILTAIIMLSEDLYTRKIGKEFLDPYTIGDTIGIVIMSAICIYFFGGVAYLIWELLKAE
ncbi:MAG: serine/threonine protein kinase [Lachnospiraceae bacterium]|nr:serine/threonine protein kinase [Lachnospiraceae bacterium]